MALHPADSFVSSFDCKNQILAMCWRNDLQHPLAVLGMGELPMDEAHGPCKDFNPPPEQPFILEIAELSMGRLQAGRQIQGKIQRQEVTQSSYKQAGEGLMQHCS